MGYALANNGRQLRVLSEAKTASQAYGIVPHKEFEILDRQKLVDFENGRTRREAHQILACFVW